jgi:hypothetical protein
MRVTLRAFLAGLFCVAAACGVVGWLSSRDSVTGRSHRARSSQTATRASDARQATSRAASQQDEPPEFHVIQQEFEDGGLGTASPFTGLIRDPRSLQELREAVRGRGRRGIAALRTKHDQLQLGSSPTRQQVLDRLKLENSIGLLYMYEGKFTEAASWIERVLRAPETPASIRTDLTAVMGIIALRRGEVENCLECVGPSSCIFPISREAVHQNQAGSREAIRWFTTYLDESPGDLRVAWLLNIAYMTLGEYPERVPPKSRIPIEPFSSKIDVGRFENVAPLVGLGTRGPNMAGGSIFDDFTGDGQPDIFTTSLDSDLGASLFINRGDGTFADRSAAAGLGDQIYALNVTRADFDNDGDLDVLLLRGAWESPLRLSLLKNKGGGVFEDVTIASGLGEPISSESAVWGDFDNDGWLDVFVCGEYLPPAGDVSASQHDPRNRCRLYHNRGDGTFVDVALEAGVLDERCAKGAAWGDYDGDGRLDLFVSNMRQGCRLYHNEGNGKFRDVAPELGVTGPSHSFACWFWDYDNDGLLDIYVNDYRARVSEVVASSLGVAIEGSSRPHLYRNLGPAGFLDVTVKVGLDRAMSPMGSNFGDVDNDGYLDLYLGTGAMSYGGLVPNRMFKNVEGGWFEDITTSSGTGHLQKGHGVSFADWDGDGDLDLLVEVGGGTPGDQAYNLLFQNPCHGRHWLKVKLIGTKTNRDAFGAKIRVDLKDHDGNTRSIHRTIGNNSSFGGNSLVETIGLLDAKSVTEFSVFWPTSRTTQTFRDLAADQAIEITEGTDSFKVLRQPTLAVPRSSDGRSTHRNRTD